MSLKPDEQIALKFRDELVGRKMMLMICKFLPEMVFRFARILFVNARLIFDGQS